MPRPTFLCIGPPKSGSTWLAAAVSQHPDVLSGDEKEVNFFNRDRAFERGLAHYESRFTNGRPDAPAVGEFSPGYLHTAGAAERIAEAYPPSRCDLRFVVCLRDPVARAVSAYYQGVRRGRIRPGAPLSHTRRRAVEAGFYADHLARWFGLYPRDRFLILCYEEDVRPDAAKPHTLRRVFEHIGVDPSFAPSALRGERNGRPSPFELRARHLPGPVQAVVRRLPDVVKAWSVWDFAMPEGDREALPDLFRVDVERLEAMLGREFPWPQTKGAEGGSPVTRSRSEPRPA